MLVTNHVLAGALLGHVAAGPVSALALGVASHFVMDAVPHWGGYELRDVLHIAVADGLVGATLLVLVAGATPRERRTKVVAGILGAALPDSDKPWDLFVGGSPFPRRFDRFHAGIQTESSRRMPQELVVGATLALAVGRVLVGVSRGSRRTVIR